MSRRHNGIVTLGSVLSVSLIAAAASFMLASCRYSRMQYNLWFLLLGLLAVPFIPFRLTRFPQIVSLKIFSWLGSLIHSPVSDAKTTVPETAGTSLTGNADWINDFALSVNSRTPSTAGYLLLGIWGIGMLAMTILVIKSAFRLHALEKSALPDRKSTRLNSSHCIESRMFY